MRKKQLKVIASIAVLVLTIVAFIYYFTKHPNTLSQLKHISPLLLVGLLLLYGIFTFAYVFIQSATLQILKIHMPMKENFLLTSYSTIVNFFGPLQSGPGVRLVYLKKRYNINIRNFIFATFLYYGFFALISGIFLTINVFAWWQTLLVITVIICGSLFVINKQRQKATLGRFPIEAVMNLALATVFQIFIVTIIYFLELHSVDHTVSFAQAMTYTGAANFALFVSLTPGAVGFRESFLLFSERLHHISSAHVLAASLIDRAANVLFLGLLFLVTLAMHAKDRFSPKQGNATSDSTDQQ